MEEKTSLKDLYISFFKIGLFTFGGGLSMLPMFEKELVYNHHWCTYEDITDYYAISQCTPGIIAVNVATFLGYKQKGTIGGIISTLGVITPSIIIISLIAFGIQNFSNIPLVQNAIKGISVGVCAIIIPSVIKLAKKSITSVFGLLLAIISFVIAAFSSLPIYLTVFIGIVGGLLYGKLKENK